MSASPPTPALPSRKKRSRRRWLQFSLRTLMLVTLLVAVFLSWLATEIKKARDEAGAVTAIRATGGVVFYQHELQTVGIGQPPDPPGPKWLRRLLGDQFFARVSVVSYPLRATDADLEHLDAIRHLTELDVNASTTSPAGRAPIWDRRELVSLCLRSNSISDEEIAQAAALTKLEVLDLSHTPVTDRVIDTLRRLQSLRSWSLDGTFVSNSAIESSIESLRHPSEPQIGPTIAPAPSQEQQQAAAAIERAGGIVMALRPEGGGEVYYDVHWMDFSFMDFSFSVRSNHDLIERLHHLEDLESINISDARLSTDDWKHLTDPTSPIRAAAFDGTSADRPPGLGSLTTLFISTDSATDDAMQQIKQLPSLKTLSVRSDQVTDVGLAHLGQIRSLEYLDISGIQPTDAGLAHLVNLKNLRELRAQGSSLTDAGLAHCAQLARLEALMLNGNPIGDPGLIQLTDLCNLTMLGLSGTQITDAGLAEIAKLRNLEWLDLSQTDISDAGLVHLAELTNLRTLRLDDTKITEAGLVHLEELEALRIVFADGTDLAPEIREALWIHGARFREATE